MKHKLIGIALSMVLLIPYACNNKAAGTEPGVILAGSTLEDTVLLNSSPVVSQDTAQERLIKKCTAYWDELGKLHAASTEYYNTVFLPKALANPALPEENRKFLLALKEYINQPVQKTHTSLAIEHPLLPIFKLEENELGVIGFPQHDYTNPEYTDISLEHKLLTKSRLAKKNINLSKYKLVTHPELADSLFKNKDKSVYAFTKQGRVKTSFKSFGSYTGECLEYYNYLLNSQPFSNNDKVLFGSRYDLNLVYKGDPAIDAMIKNQYSKVCQDCPNNGDLVETFATLKEVEGLYFTYADTFPLNNKLETPTRGLVMKMNDKAVHLWYQSVDLIGCSCI